VIYHEDPETERDVFGSTLRGPVVAEVADRDDGLRHPGFAAGRPDRAIDDMSDYRGIQVRTGQGPDAL
jgi:hypothetical protein